MKNSNKEDYIICIALFVLSPVLGLFTSAFKLSKGDKNNIILIMFASSISLILAYQPPMFDTVFNFPDYFYTKESGFSKIILNVNNDNLYISLLSCSAKIFNLGYYSIILLTIFFAYYGCLCIVKKEAFNSSNYIYKSLVLLSVLFLFPRYILDLNRFTLSVIIIIISSTLLFKKSKIIGVFLIIFACFIHKALIIPVLISLIVYVLFNVVNFKINPWANVLALIFILMLGFYFSNSLLLRHFDFLESVLDKNLSSYSAEGEWGQVARGFGRVLTEYISLTIILIINFFVIKYMPFLRKNFLLSVFIVSSYVTCFFFSFRTMCERYLILSLLSGFVIIVCLVPIIANDACKDVKKILNSLILLNVFVWVLGVYQYRYIYTDNYEALRNNVERRKISYHLYYYPSPVLMFTEECGFSEDFFNRNFKN